MKLPFLKFLKKEEKPKFYLAFVLRHEKALAVIFEQTGAEAKVVGKSEAYFTKDIESASFEELLNVSDKAISKAEDGIPDDADSLQTLFGLKETWIEDDKIKKNYLEKLKKVSDELGLVPIGFITVTEAITSLIKKEEGAPLTAILTEIGKNYVTASLIKAGKTIETKSSEIHESPAFTTDVLLKHFETPQVLPSKIIIYDGDNNDLSQKFISHKWSKSLPFLHLPQIISLPDGFDAKAILQGAATKMGFSVVSDASLKTSKNEEEIPAFSEIDPTETTDTKIIENEKDAVGSKLEEDSKEKINFVEDEGFIEKFGFLENNDVLKSSPASSTTDASAVSEKETEQEIGKESNITIETQREQEIEDEIVEEIKLRKKSEGITEQFKKIQILVTNFARKLKLPKNKSVTIGSAVILGIIILFTFLALNLKTTVVLTLSPKIDEQKQNVIFSSDNTDVDKKIIKGELIETSIEETVSANTTGIEETGTEAKGEIIFYSRFTKKTTIPAKTVISSSNDIGFVLDKDVEIASASADASSEPSTAKGSVTAKNIGKESNLPSGTKFNVGDLSPSNIIAKNESAFSGGTKKEITVVSEEDTEKLLEQIVKDLEEKAIEELKNKINPEEKGILPVIVDSNFEEKNFDKDIGDETTKLTLKAIINFQGLAYPKKDLLSFTESLLEKELSGDMEIDKNNLTVDVTNIEEGEDEEVLASLNIKAPLLPKINKEELVKTLTNKPKEEAKDMLLKISQVEDVDINPSIPIPFLTNYLPRFSNNIDIVIKTDE